MTLIGTVESVFTLSSRGTVVAVIRRSGGTVRRGDKIHLKTPDGVVTDSEILGIELIKKAGSPCQEAYMLPGHLPQTKIPAGTEIWLR